MTTMLLRTRALRAVLLWSMLLSGLCVEGRAQSGEAPVGWNEALDQEAGWYGSAEAVRIADNVLLYQHANGGWPKNIDMARRLAAEDRLRIRAEQADGGTTLSHTTLDNGATYSQMRYLARVHAATGHDRFAEGVLRGLAYLLEAQYANGGWPQYYPLREGYYTRITFNDGAMTGALAVLRDVAAGQPPFDFVEAARRADAEASLARGIAAVLQMQIRQDGRLTAWCAQYDEATLEPAWGRAYEPPSLSGAESVGIVRFLMSLEAPTPEIVAAVEGAVGWLRDVAIRGVRYERFTDDEGRRDRRVVPDPDAGALWARFYELGTDRPIFLGRDSVVRYALAEIEQERRGGYRYYGDWAERLLAQDYRVWRDKHDLSPEPFRPRVIHTTDLGADPDDEQSLVRFLVMANEFDVEGLVVATGCWKKQQDDTAMLDRIVDAYGEVVDNLQRHAEGFPSAEYLRSVSVVGQRGYGMSDVGDGRDSPGSDLIVAAVDADDPRPVWATCWGGCNTIAQALYRVQQTRSPAEVAAFVGKLRVYDVLGQDDAGTWIAKTFPDLLYIRATGVYGWAPSDDWIDEHVQSHGPLGTAYPDRKYATEGDTPAFLHLYPSGLNDPDRVAQGGWGGRFDAARQAGIRGMSCMEGEDAPYDPYLMHGNTPEGAESIRRWRPAYDNDFAARMDWSIADAYADANHHPVAVVNGDASRQVLYLSAEAGASVTLSAEGSSDPDGDELIYSWFFYREPSSYAGPVEVRGSTAETATVSLPTDARGETIHLLLELHDTGSPNLYAYRRVVVAVR